MHFWLVFVMPHAKGHIFCEDCVAAILKDSIQTSIINRTSVGSLQGLAVDMDSVVLNGDYWVILLQALLPAVLLILFYCNQCCHEVQSSLCIHGLCIHGFNQPWVENIQKKKSRKFQKAKLEFAAGWQIYTAFMLN